MVSEINFSEYLIIKYLSSATTEDVIDIGDLDYEWQFSEASEKLENFVKSFELFKIGLRSVFKILFPYKMT